MPFGVRRAVSVGRQFASRLHESLRGLRPAEQASRALRLEMLGRLDDFARRDRGAPAVEGCVLVDGMWDNANYWIRYALVRRALGLTRLPEVGVLGVHARSRVREGFARLGIRDLVDYRAGAAARSNFRSEAKRLLALTRAPEDILDWELPSGFPGTLVFDGLLKRQRRATIDLSDPLLPGQVAEALSCIAVAEAVFEDRPCGLVVLSHALDYTYAAIAWAAMRRGVPVLVLYGDYGVSRFIRLNEAEDLFAYPGRPSVAEMRALAGPADASLHRAGKAYLDMRLAGRTDDVGARYAYQRRRAPVTRAALCARFGWDPARPVIGVYAANWFDYPHVTGLSVFRDFLDWTELTLDVAGRRTDVNWLFKAHPCDDWYADIRGARLQDLVEHAPRPNIRLADASWNGNDLIQCLDGIVTCHGTIGIEAAARGKPVLTAHKGWYGHAGFTRSPDTRRDYFAALQSRWWSPWDADAAAAAAERFAGWYFCAPAWHGSYVFRDDSEQDAIFAGLPDFLARNDAALRRETETIRAWFESGHPYYHIYKMSRADRFAVVGGESGCAADAPKPDRGAARRAGCG